MQNSTGKFSVGIFLSAFFCVFFSFGETLAAAGDLDFSFGNQGRQVILIPNPQPAGMIWNTAEDIVIQPDGKILVAGAAYHGINQFDWTVTRFNPNGSLDSSFASGGVFRYDFTGSDDKIYGIVLQPDGKIVVAGQAYLGVVNGNADTAFGVMRLNPNGSFDSSFGNGGIVITNFFSSLDYASEVALQPDGKIIATGIVTQGGVNDGRTYDFAAVRYNPNGSLDATYGSGGIVFVDFNGLGDRAQTSLLQPDGKIVMAGWVYTTIPAQLDFGLARLNADGSLDTTFDGDGKVVTTFGPNWNELVRGMSLAPDGKIVVAGDSYVQPPIIGQDGDWHITVARYNTNGSLDTSFDGDGKFIFDSNEGDGSVEAQDVIVQPDAKILLLGGSHLIQETNPSVAHRDMMLFRLNVNGTFDGSFGNGGRTLTDFGIFNPPGAPTYGSGRTSETGIAAAIALQPDGKIVVGTDIVFGRADRRLGVARFQNDITSLVPARGIFDFDGDGKTDISIYRPANGEWWYLRSSNGGNSASSFGASSDKIVPADFTGDGKTDVAFFRESSGEWFVLRSENSSYYSFPFGASGDIPAAGDFDGDNKADPTVFRPSNSTWYINKSTGGTLIQQFGLEGDAPVAADYDGDGKSDIAIWRAPAGEWWINKSTGGVIAFSFGNSLDKAVQGDYTGDGKDDVAVWRPSTGEWFVLRSENQSYYSFPFGTNGDIPVVGDYDGDGKTDAAVFRPSESTWYMQRTTAGTLIQSFGQTGDKPVPNAFVP